MFVSRGRIERLEAAGIRVPLGPNYRHPYDERESHRSPRAGIVRSAFDSEVYAEAAGIRASKPAFIGVDVIYAGDFAVRTRN